MLCFSVKLRIKTDSKQFTTQDGKSPELEELADTSLLGEDSDRIDNQVGKIEEIEEMVSSCRN